MESMQELAAAVGCSKYPQRWDAIFHQVKKEYQENGCPYVLPEFYAKLKEKYGILQELLPLYQQAAVETAQDENLSLFLFVLCRALRDRQYHQEDMAQFSAPKKQKNLAYRMLQALALASVADMCFELLQYRGLPDDVRRYVMKMPEGGVASYAKRHGGEYGHNLLEWFLLAIDGKIFRAGRLEFELFASFNGKARVFENQQLQHIALADGIQVHRDGIALNSAGYENSEGSWVAELRETKDNWIGYPVGADGTVGNKTVSLPKNTWKCILSPGDPVVGVHIPAGGGLTPEIVDKSLMEIKQLIRDYFPEYEYKAFTCHSWLMDPQLQTMVGADSNIALFQNRFTILPVKSSGKGVFNFLFLKPNMDFDLADLPENTRLERKVKQHYLNGKYIYELIGYFF